MIKGKNKMISGLDKGVSVDYKTKKVLENSKFHRILGITGSWRKLTNNEIKDITKVIRSLENRGILSKGTTKKISGHKGQFLNFLRPFCLPLMKNVLTSLPKIFWHH